MKLLLSLFFFSNERNTSEFVYPLKLRPVPDAPVVSTFDLEVVFLDPRLDSHECSPCELEISGPSSPPVLPDNFLY